MQKHVNECLGSAFFYLCLLVPFAQPTSTLGVNCLVSTINVGINPRGLSERLLGILAPLVPAGKEVSADVHVLNRLAELTTESTTLATSAKLAEILTEALDTSARFYERNHILEERSGSPPELLQLQMAEFNLEKNFLDIWLYSVELVELGLIRLGNTLRLFERTADQKAFKSFIEVFRQYLDVYGDRLDLLFDDPVRLHRFESILVLAAAIHIAQGTSRTGLPVKAIQFIGRSWAESTTEQKDERESDGIPLTVTRPETDDPSPSPIRTVFANFFRKIGDTSRANQFEETPTSSVEGKTNNDGKKNELVRWLPAHPSQPLTKWKQARPSTSPTVIAGITVDPKRQALVRMHSDEKREKRSGAKALRSKKALKEFMFAEGWRLIREHGDHEIYGDDRGNRIPLPKTHRHGDELSNIVVTSVLRQIRTSKME